MSPRADHVTHIAQVEHLDLDVLVLVLLRRFVRHRQPRQTEEDHLLVAVAGRWMQRGQAHDGVGHLADLFVALPPRGLLRRFAWIHAAGGQLPQDAVQRVPVLADQGDLSAFRNRDQHDGLRVTDDVDRHLAAVRHPHAVAIDVEDLPVVDAFVGEALRLAHGSILPQDAFGPTSIAAPRARNMPASGTKAGPPPVPARPRIRTIAFPQRTGRAGSECSQADPAGRPQPSRPLTKKKGALMLLPSSAVESMGMGGFPKGREACRPTLLTA